MNVDLTRFEPQKDDLKSMFVDNECGTDEYRETQPFKGMRLISAALEMLEAARWEPRPQLGYRKKREPDDERPEQSEVERLTSLTAEWLTAWNAGERWGSGGGLMAPVSHGYAGADDLVPCLEMVFDIFWRNGEHPYGYTETDIEEILEN